MIRVVHIITKLEQGGAQENTLHTCKTLDRDRFAVTLVHGGGGQLDEQARKITDMDDVVVPELIRYIRPRTDAKCLRELTAVLRDIRRRHWASSDTPDGMIVHTHSSKAGILGRMAARLAGVPIIVHSIHGFGFFESQPPLKYHSFLKAERFVARFTDAFVGVSRANLAEARARHIVGPKHEVALIRSGFDLDLFRSVSSNRVKALRTEFSLQPEQEVILCVANLKSQKDPATLVEAMAHLKRRRSGAVLLYAGDGEMRASVERAIERHGVGDTFRLLGWREDVPDLMALADVVALSSLYEGLPKVAVQALVARKPFVGTRVDGTPEVIREGSNGYLVEPRAPEAFAKALYNALERRPVDPQDVERVQAWDQDEMVRAQERLYERLLRN